MKILKIGTLKGSNQVRRPLHKEDSELIFNTKYSKNQSDCFECPKDQIKKEDLFIKETHNYFLIKNTTDYSTYPKDER